MTTYTNRFFVYEGDILRAAQSKFSNAAKYMKAGRQIFWGNPDNTKERNLTNIYNKLNFKNTCPVS